jgi:hypothetical protein
MQHNNFSGFKLFKTGTILFLVLIAVLMIIPFVRAASTTTENSAKVGDNKNISLRIYQPKEGSISYNDVGLPYVVLGEIDAVNGIRNVTITSGHDLVICGNNPMMQLNLFYGKNSGTHLNLFCDVPRNFIEKQQYIITVFDSRGDVASITRNFTLIGSIPPPDFFTHFSAHGKVTDPDGNPLSNVSIVFEFPDARVWGPEITDFRSFIRNVTTGSDGIYSTEFIEEGRTSTNQTVNVMKEGYRPLTQNIKIRNDTNEINFVLTPITSEHRSSPGFDFVFGIIALVSVFLIIMTRTRR